MDFIYKKLIVWQKSMDFARMVYRATRAFPPDERFALTDQLRRAAVSVPSNIAEGNGRTATRDYGHFLAMARGSLYEALTQLELAKDAGYVADIGPFEDLAAEISRMLTAMLQKYGLIQQQPTTNSEE